MGKRVGSALELLQIPTPGAAPASGSNLLYFKTDGNLYKKDTNGFERIVDPPTEVAFTFAYTGVPLEVVTGTTRLPVVGNCSIGSIAAMVGEAPTVSSVILDINKNGTSIFDTQENRPHITPGSNSAVVGSYSVSSLAAGDYLTVDVDQVGSGTPGANLTVVITVLKTGS